MELHEALTSRRSIRKFSNRTVPEDTVRDLLSYAPWVPNHHVSEPWRFIVLRGSSKEHLAQLRFDVVLRKRQGQEHAEQRALRSKSEFLEAPWIIVTIQSLDSNPVRREEDYASCAMATYNIMLRAHDLGLGTFWTTGPLMDAPEIRDFLQLSEDERPVAFVRLGYPDMSSKSLRSTIDQRVQWRD